MKALNSLLISGREVLPIIEGGKGISVSNGESSGAWAASGGVGTFSGVNADSYDANGKLIPQVYKGKTRRDRHEELIAYAIQGGITQAKKAYELERPRPYPHQHPMGDGVAEHIVRAFWKAPKASSTA